MVWKKDFNPKVVDGECREFLVFPPAGVQFDEPAVQSRVAEALREAFPESGFTVTSGGEPLREEDDFVIFPVVEEKDGVRTSRLPRADVVEEIGTFLTVNFANIRAPKLH